MSKVKSIRFNDRTERMFNVVKKYYSDRGSVSDSEIITRGIELQYDDVSSDLNLFFRKKMQSMLTNSMFGTEVFKKVCDMLEVLSISQGSLLQDEFWCFLKVNVEGSSIYNVFNGERELVSKQYEKIYETVIKTYDEKSLERTLAEMSDYFQQLFENDYKEIK